MKELLKTIFLVCLLVGLVTVGFAAEAAFDFAWAISDDGTEFTVRLPANGTTGYEWNWTLEGGALREKSSQYIVAEQKDGIVGAGGIREFVFTAGPDGAGRTTLALEYNRPWETEASAIAYEITLWIREGGILAVETIRQTMPWPWQVGDVTRCPECGLRNAKITEIISGGDEESGVFIDLIIECLECGTVQETI